jgi:hypothetical protein
VEVEYDKDESRLTKITKIDDELAAAPPPFSILYFEIHATSSLYNLGPHDFNEPIREIRARYQQEPEILFGGRQSSLSEDTARQSS